MLSDLAEFEVLILHYDKDPRNCSKLLRTYARDDPKTFLSYAEGAILKQSCSRAMQLVVSIALSAGLVQHLFRLHSSSRERAISVAEKAVVCEPLVETRIWEFLQGYVSAPDEEAVFHAGLDILDTLSKDDRLISRVLKFVRDHPNPKIRAKAVMFVGRRTQNLAWIASHTNETENARVRATVLESISGNNSDFVRQTFRGRLRDPNNRVAGNAALGLYQLKDTTSIPAIYEMAAHGEPLFRNTAAWVMGQTRDIRFVDVLLEMTKDTDELVQKQAQKSLDELEKVREGLAAQPLVQVGVVSVGLHNGEAKIRATVQDAKGQLVRGISPTSFIVKTGAARQSVRRYVVDEYECKVALSTGFVLCLDSKESADSEAAFLQAIRSCDGLRRQKDRWAVLKLAPQKRPAAEVPPDSFLISSRSRYAILNVDEITTPVRTAAAFQETLDARYTGAPDQIEAMFKHAPLLLSGLAGDRGVKTALETLLQVGGGWTNPHLIFLGASASPYLIEELLAKGTRPAATVHVIAQSAAWKTQEVRRIVELTGGLYREPKDAAGLESACVEICSSLQHHYTVRWKQESIAAVELEICSELARGSVQYQAEWAAASSGVPSSV